MNLKKIQFGLEKYIFVKKNKTSEFFYQMSSFAYQENFDASFATCFGNSSVG